MKRDEYAVWIASFWGATFGAALILGAWVGSGELKGGMTAPLVFLGALVIVWLFRVTYLAGRKNS